MVNEHISEAAIKVFALFNEKEPPPKIALVLDIENIIHEALQVDRLMHMKIHETAKVPSTPRKENDTWHTLE